MDAISDDLFDVDLSAGSKRNESKITYKDRKIDHKLNKYETILKNLENITREACPSKFLFVGNCGLDNNISREFLTGKFSQYGLIIDVVMQHKKSYSFVVYEDEAACERAIEALQGTIIESTDCQSPMCYFLFPVDKVPDLCELTNTKLPDGLIYLDNFIDDQYGREIVDFIMNDQVQAFSDLKNRRVKHYGYEFRYGTNDVDETKPLEAKIPVICDKILEECLNQKLIHVKPDQLTVNLYEPGQGIPPHVDNIRAFDDYIMSLSLLSSAVMDFRLKQSNSVPLVNSLCLKPNSLLILKSDSRYKWSHSIAERKHDLTRAAASNEITVMKRDVRLSLTFRKIAKKSAAAATENLDSQLPSNDDDAVKFESSYVHKVYNEIAEHFSNTRHSAWPGVAEFVHGLPKHSYLLDVGCGNGKYLNLRNDIFAFGCDYSTELIAICQKRNFSCFVSDCLNIPIADNFFDCVICIAVLHHLSTQNRRVKAIQEMLRILKVGGQALVTVWAQEQKLNDQESYYIKPKKTNKKEQSDKFCVETNAAENVQAAEANNAKPTIHDYGKPFEKQDLFVTWHHNKKQQQADENVFLRFYHVFVNGELEDLFKAIPNAKIVRSFYEQGNWCVVFEKTF